MTSKSIHYGSRLLSATALSLAVSLSAHAGFFDFDNDLWDQANVTLSPIVAAPGGVGFEQSAHGTLFLSTVDADLLALEANADGRTLKYQDNHFDRLTFNLYDKSGSVLGFDSLLKSDAEQWAKDNSNSLLQSLFGGGPGRYITGQTAAHGEASLVMEQLVFNSNRNKKVAKDKLSISHYGSDVDGYLSYTDWDNGDFTGSRTGLTMGYNTDINERLEFNFLLPYQYVASNDIANSSSHVITPGLGLKYHVLENASADLFVGGYFATTAVYSEGDLGSIGYLRYGGSIYASYTYYVQSDLAVTAGGSLGFGRYDSPSLDKEYKFIEDALNDYGTDVITGLGVQVEYAINNQLGLDVFIHYAHNSNSDLDNTVKNQYVISPQLRYTVSDAFEAALAYKRTEGSGGSDYSADAIMLNGIYRF